MVSSFTVSTPSESFISLWISVTAHVPIFISLNCAANQLLILPASKRATSQSSTTILSTRPKMAKITTTPLSLRRSINLFPHPNLSTFSHPPSEFTTPPPPLTKTASWNQLLQSMFQRRQASRPTTRCLFRERMLVPCRAQRFNHRVSILALRRDRHIPQTRESRVRPLAPGYQNPPWHGNILRQEKSQSRGSGQIRIIVYKQKFLSHHILISPTSLGSRFSYFLNSPEHIHHSLLVFGRIGCLFYCSCGLYVCIGVGKVRMQAFLISNNVSDSVTYNFHHTLQNKYPSNAQWDAISI